MKGSSAIALILLGGATFVGVGVLFRKAGPSLFQEGPLLFFTMLAMAVVAALFVFGVFLGFLYGKAAPSRKLDGSTLKRFRDALGFERRERTRLERALFEAKQMTVSLEDRLQKEAARAREQEASKEAVPSEEMVKLQEEISTLSSHQERLRSDLFKRKERVADLLAELSVSQTEAEAARKEADKLKESFEPPHPATVLLPGGESIREVLEGMVALDGVQMALVADDYGLVVETAGDGLPSETLAAISALTAEIGPRLRDILPMSEITTVALGDDKGLVLETYYFELLETHCALAVARDEARPRPGLAEQAIQSITARLK
ncbi:MAG: hypothetical protein GY854_09905 [Deltaproteobacteria bacterium]|nr:hypothetical protein [Deltaproteobacteria bacterium]